MSVKPDPGLCSPFVRSDFGNNINHLGWGDDALDQARTRARAHPPGAAQRRTARAGSERAVLL
jgi:hypothetical protein